jgi:hypothetical protein
MRHSFWLAGWRWLKEAKELRPDRRQQAVRPGAPSTATTVLGPSGLGAEVDTAFAAAAPPTLATAPSASATLPLPPVWMVESLFMVGPFR